MTHARQNPGRLNHGSGGNGSAGHLAGEMFKTQAGLFIVHIPYAAQLMAEPAPGTPAQFAAFVKAELAKYGPVVKASGAQVD